jgi:hypothetical protein
MIHFLHWYLTEDHQTQMNVMEGLNIDLVSISNIRQIGLLE